jgi:hypothetical protein
MINVLPVNDLKEHVEATHCWCNPRVEIENDEMIVIHNSLDKREIVEQAYEHIRHTKPKN